MHVIRQDHNESDRITITTGWTKEYNKLESKMFNSRQSAASRTAAGWLSRLDWTSRTAAMISTDSILTTNSAKCRQLMLM